MRTESQIFRFPGQEREIRKGIKDRRRGRNRGMGISRVRGALHRGGKDEMLGKPGRLEAQFFGFQHRFDMPAGMQPTQCDTEFHHTRDCSSNFPNRPFRCHILPGSVSDPPGGVAGETPAPGDAIFPTKPSRTATPFCATRMKGPCNGKTDPARSSGHKNHPS